MFLATPGSASLYDVLWVQGYLLLLDLGRSGFNFIRKIMGSLRGYDIVVVSTGVNDLKDLWH